MATHVIHKHSNQTVKVNTDGDTWILAKDSVFNVNGKYAISDEYHSNTTIKLLGEITVKQAGLSAAVMQGDGARLIIGRSADIDASEANGAIQGNGANMVIINHGHVESGAGGLIMTNGGTVENDGELLGFKGITAFDQQGHGLEVSNRGLIDVASDGIWIDGAVGHSPVVHNFKAGEIRSDDVGVRIGSSSDATLINDGLIKADRAIIDFSSSATIRNHGRIVGTIDLGNGEDTLDLGHGTFKGTAYGGDGSDIYIVSRQSTDIREHFLGGADTVQSTVSYVLKDNFENLQLLGTKDRNGTGNDSGNDITGNGGDNTLLGMDGADTISGAAGNDILEGGAGIDTFVFSTGFGNDVINDLENGVDKIDLSDWAGVDSLIDITTNHLTVDGNDVVITNGSDTLRLKDTSSAELELFDFAF